MDYFNDELEEITEEELKSLCIQFIEILKELKEGGKITEEEYYQHTKLKEEYVQYIVKRKSDEVLNS